MNFWKSFVRVLASYSIEEKVVSLVVALVVVVFAVQAVLETVTAPEFEVGESGVYTEGLVSDQAVLLNPVYIDLSEANRQISSLIFTGLTKYDPKVGAFVEDMAVLKVSEDRKTYSFTLKDGIMWHDGTLVTANDVFFTFRDVIQHQDFQNPVLKANFEGVEIRKVDDKTVEFILTGPNSFFITNLNVGILPKHLLEGIPVGDLPFHKFNIAPVGTGPFAINGQLDSLPNGRQRLLLKRNDTYYGQKSSLKNIRFKVYPDSESLLQDQKALNVIAKVPTNVVGDIHAGGRFEFLRYQLPQYTAVFMNMDVPVLQKEKVRIALQKAVDKKALLELLPNRQGVDTPLMDLEQDDWLYEPNLEEARGALFDSGYKMDPAPVVEEEAPVEAEGEAAAEVPAEAPATETSEEATTETPAETPVENPAEEPVVPAEDLSAYRKNSDGEVLSLRLLVRKYEEGTSLQQEMAGLTAFLVSAWKEAGVKIELQFEAQDVFSTRVQSRDYDLIITGQSLGYNLDTYAYWHSTEASEKGLNLANFKNFAADSIIENIRDTFDNAEKDEFLKRLAGVISADVPAIFLYRPSYFFATDGKLQGVYLENMAYVSDRFALIKDWCIVCE